MTGSDGSNNMPPQSTHITAAAGGTVQDPAGDFVLEIPPGALAADTDITLAVVPAYAEAITSVAVFGPSGLTFSTPATLSIRVATGLVPANKVPVVSLDTAGAFIQVENSISYNLNTTGMISAPVSHFSSYAASTADWDHIRCEGNLLPVTVQAEQDPTVTVVTYDGNGNIYVPGLYKDVLNTSCNPPIVQHMTGFGSGKIPYCIATCATGGGYLSSSDAAVAHIVYSSNSCGAFSSPPEDYFILGDFLVANTPNNHCQ